MLASLENNSLYRVAVIGAGPAGFYTAAALLKQHRFRIEVDLFDRLPTPYGLVRGGVAPDHQNIKAVTGKYEKIARKPGFRFFGNVEFGEDIQPGDLTPYYHQIVFATGAQKGKQLNIPGSGLAGSYPASDFVSWYNGHPDYATLKFDLSQEQVVIIGMGNVALDVARILCRTPQELAATDIASYALEALSHSQIKEVTLLGRRGPAQAAFTPPEIKEICRLTGVDITIKPPPDQLDDLSQGELVEAPDENARHIIAILRTICNREVSGKARQLKFRFLASPVALLGGGSGHVDQVRLVENELVLSPDGKIKAQPTHTYEEIPAGLVFHAIGYRGVPLPGVPFDARRGTILHQDGRVSDPQTGVSSPGLYAAGWIKRGPYGVIGSNKQDAKETVAAMLADLETGHHLHPPYPVAARVEDMLCRRQPRFVLFENWLHLDQIEITRGQAQQRPRDKFTRVAEMLQQMEIVD